jgi:mannosyltransferase
VLARRLFDRRVALFSGLFLATSPYFVKWSQQARVYPFLAALAIVATLLLLRALDRGTRGPWALYGVAYTGLLVTHAVVGLLLVPAHAVLIAQRRRQALPHALLAGVVIVGLGAPWVAQLALRTSDEMSETAWIPYPSAEYVTGAFLGVSGAAGLGLALAALGLWMLRRAGEQPLAVWLGAWAFGPFLLALIVSIARPVFLDRYLVIAAPAFAMLAAVAVMSLVGRVRVGVAAAALVATGMGLGLWYQTTIDGNWRGEDWRSAVAAALARSSDAEVVVVAPWWAHDAAEYYGAPAQDVATAPSVWVLYWSEDGPEIAPDVRRSLGIGEHRLVDRLPFGWRLTAQLWKRQAH